MWGYISAALDINCDFFTIADDFPICHLLLPLISKANLLVIKELSLQDCRPELECKWNVPECPHVMQQMAMGHCNLQLLPEWLQLDRPVWLSVEITTYQSPESPE